MRDFRIDNIKGALIILVVFGHLLELSLKNPYARTLYICIYMFHMPLFVFTTGYFAKLNVKKLMKNILYPYCVFSLLYQICAIWIWKDMKKPNFLTPYWLLWYLFAVMIWTISLPLWEKLKGYKAIIFLFLSVMVACVAGYFEMIGRVASLSRVLVFFPFFVAGKYWHRHDGCFDSIRKYMKPWGKAILIVMILGLFIIIGWKAPSIMRTWVYEATDYAESKYSLGFRICHIVVGFIMIFASMMLCPAKKLGGISKLGQHTMIIFLLHGFVIKTFSTEHVATMLGLDHLKMMTVFIAMITVTILVTILSSSVVRKLSAPFLAFSFGGKR